MRDRPSAVLRVFAGQRDNGADLLRAEGRRGAWARGVRQPVRDARIRVFRPSPPPRLDRGATDTQLVGGRPYPDIPTRQQDNPRTDGQLLRTGRLSLKHLQLPTLAIGDVDWGSTK
jgi:hypothetical protein